MIGGFTSYDDDARAQAAIQSLWIDLSSPVYRLKQLTGRNVMGIELTWSKTVHLDGAVDMLCGGDGVDLVFSGFGDELYLRRDDLKVAKRRP